MYFIFPSLTEKNEHSVITETEEDSLDINTNRNERTVAYVVSCKKQSVT